MPKSWDDYCEEQERWQERRPVCHICGEKCLDDYAYKLDGDFACQKCFDEYVDEIKVDLEDW